MAVRAARRTSAREAEPLTDVLVSGGDDPPRRPSSRQRLGAAALLLAGVTALVVPLSRSDDGPADAAGLDLALREGSIPLPRRDAPPVQDRVEGGVHVEVVNHGATPVRLRSGSLSPGAWQVEVVDDLDASADPGGEGRLLRPGWVAMLVLHRTFPCAPGADAGPAPTSLSLDVEVEGRPRTWSVGVGPEQAAYGGRLAGLLGSAETFCAAGGTAGAATAGSPGLPFLPLWPAGAGVLPSP